jgi:beta-phosphoglucomutase-like phosphatase (HAD superfamily)
MNQRPEALIFDFDGVLADTERLHWKAWAMRMEAKRPAMDSLARSTGMVGTNNDTSSSL